MNRRGLQFEIEPPRCLIAALVAFFSSPALQATNHSADVQSGAKCATGYSNLVPDSNELFRRLNDHLSHGRKREAEQVQRQLQRVLEGLSPEAPVVARQEYQRLQDLFKSGNLDAARAFEKELSLRLKSQPLRFLEDTSEGIFGARIVQLPDGTLGIWKPLRAAKDQFQHEGAAEIAAARVDRQLGLNRVPTTVLRTFEGHPGTLQLMVGDLTELSENLAVPGELRLFDYLIANLDRKKNFLKTNDGRIVAIDHGAAFKKTPRDHFPDAIKMMTKKTSRLTQNEKSELQSVVGSEASFRRLKETLVSEWQSILKDGLESQDIEAFLERRGEIIEAIELAREKFGAAIFAAP